MKLIVTILALLFFCSTYAQNIISGKISDEEGILIEGANVYLQGTIDGTTSTITGEFSFETQEQGDVTLIISYIGFDEYIKTTNISELHDISVSLKKSDLNMEEVVITASSFSLGKSNTVEKMNSLDIVMTGSSNGDIYGAIQSLPGTQKVGEDGKLYIRGGEDRETQTFIDGMHVLVPYSSPAQNMPARSRFSPFLFKGINFSLGGYESEYGQALSSVLPMETKDVASSTKIGVNVSPLSAAGGGTYSFGKQSISGNITYTTFDYYNKVLKDKYDWEKEYATIAAQTQYKTEVGTSGIFKLYLGFDQTGFVRNITDELNSLPTRNFDLDQNNYYINSTYRTLTNSKYDVFFGAAFSGVNNKYGSASIQDDLFEEKESELHLKTRIKKSFAKGYKLNTGVESYIRTYENQYTDQTQTVLQKRSLDNSIHAVFVDNQFKITKGLYTNASGRLEYSTYNNEFAFSPRLSMNYINNNFQASAIFGKYYQTPQNTIIAANPIKLKQESAIHYIVGSSYNFDDRLLRIELYHKDYDNLSLRNDNGYTSDGFGISSGLDVYFTDSKLIKDLEYTISYSYNDSNRLYKNYPVASTPLFTTDHNATLSAKYLVRPIKTYIGLSNTYASGRPFNNPNLEGFVNSKAKSFHSLDMNITFLLTKKVILYTSLSNVLGRENIFGYRYSNELTPNNNYKSEPITVSRDRFFYIGLFISLKNNSAYDVSNF